jgi:hypothetical protein
LHRDQGIVERFNRTLAEKLFTYQYARELENTKERSHEWVARLSSVLKGMNDTVTRLTGVKPNLAIKRKTITADPSQPTKSKDIQLPIRTVVRYLYQPGELEGGRQRATDPIWSITIHRIERTVLDPGQPILYYLEDGPNRSFVQEELQVIA